NSDFTPAGDVDMTAAGLEASDTAMFKLRVDYVLPAAGIDVVRSGVWRNVPAGGTEFPSDHFPVWVDMTVPAPD
ncbi:MAG: hypothetical protein ACOYN0_16515, partial [Phycisphaerales bacterium]